MNDDLVEKVDCPECGSDMNRRSFIDKNGKREIYWVCPDCEFEFTEFSEAAGC
jgi:transposase-like protein